jgi:hypothetical protein
MTDDPLDRALLALPLEEPPPDLRERILAATVLAPAPAFRAWELWLVMTLTACAAWLCADVLRSGALASRLVHPSLLLWLAIGGSSVWWISNLSLMPQPRIAATNKP